MPVTYTSEQVADIVRMAIDRDRVERVLPSLPVAPVAMPPVKDDASTPLSLSGDMAALASFAGSKAQQT